MHLPIQEKNSVEVKTKKPQIFRLKAFLIFTFEFYSRDPIWIRTKDLQIRNLLLYPAEL